jgi:OOP family OmpA-OmpF porin
MIGYRRRRSGMTTRAEAVLARLTTKYAVPAGRLRAYGSGPYAPVASNDSEDGRGKSRRVELVKQ